MHVNTQNKALHYSGWFPSAKGSGETLNMPFSGRDNTNNGVRELRTKRLLFRMQSGEVVGITILGPSKQDFLWK